MTVVVDNGLALNSAIEAKLATIQAGATANATNAQLRDRATHTGTQLAATVSDFATSVRSTALTGLSTATTTPVTAADTVLTAAGKLQRQATDNAALLPTLFDTAWYRSGLYYDAVYPYYTTISQTTGAVGVLYLCKRKILDDVTFNQLSVNVTTAAGNSSVFYGVYASDASGLPSTILAAGAASGETAGVKPTPISLALTKGQVVWDAFLNTGAAAGVTAFQPIFQGGAVSPIVNGTVALTKSSQASLPADASVGGAFTQTTTSKIPRIALRAA